MSTAAGAGYSVHRNPAVAGREAAQQALKQAGIVKPDFVLVFATVGYDQRILVQAVRDATLHAPLVGCSAEGVIANGVVIETNFCVGVMVVSSDELRFDGAHVTEMGRSPGSAGERLGAAMGQLARPDSFACFLFPDGLTFNFDPFRAAFEGASPLLGALPCYGGLAADNGTTQRTYQYRDDEVMSDGVSSAIMSGKAKIACGIDHGCVPVGTRRTVTRSRGNVIQEIDGQPALEVLKEYFVEAWSSHWNKITMNLGLGFEAPEHIRGAYGEHVIRYIMGKDDRDGSVRVQSDIQEGAGLWIVRRDPELIRLGLQKMARRLTARLGADRPKFVLQFDCVARGKVVLRERDKIELIRALQADVGKSIPWLGFYSYGEIGPIESYNCFHNFTTVVTAVY
jgi:hypothetical protein